MVAETIGEKNTYPLNINPLYPYDQERILHSTQIHGGEFNGQVLTPEGLDHQNLEPRYSIPLDNETTIHFSLPYSGPHGHVAAVGYVEKDGHVTARTYYRSQSQGLWRLLPYYKTNEYGDASHYGKGYGEASITLPWQLQASLSSISETHEPLQGTEGRDLAFVGTAHQKRGSGEMGDQAYYQEVDSHPIRLNGTFYESQYSSYTTKTPPEEMHIDIDQYPVFSRPMATWHQRTDLYGDVKMQVFPSRDGKMAYTFCRNENGMTWISSVEEIDSPYTSAGVRRDWIDGGDLVTPAFEHPKITPDQADQTGGYGNVDNMRGGYVDMSTNYLDRVFVIRDYQSHVYNSPVIQEAAANVSGDDRKISVDLDHDNHVMVVKGARGEARVPFSEDELYPNGIIWLEASGLSITLQQEPSTEGSRQANPETEQKIEISDINPDHFDYRTSDDAPRSLEEAISRLHLTEQERTQIQPLIDAVNERVNQDSKVLGVLEGLRIPETPRPYNPKGTIDLIVKAVVNMYNGGTPIGQHTPRLVDPDTGLDMGKVYAELTAGIELYDEDQRGDHLAKRLADDCITVGKALEYLRTVNHDADAAGSNPAVRRLRQAQALLRYKIADDAGHFNDNGNGDIL